MTDELAPDGGTPDEERSETDEATETAAGGEESANEGLVEGDLQAESASANEEDATEEDADDAEESRGKPRPPAKLERLQKILAQAGVASRRHAEELIKQGRVQVNGKVVTELGTKADGGRDHIRVDGKLLQGAERLRYFVLNKPRGFVTTAKDPEGRPTVMQFFEKMRERLYPVGRLDYMSEGLLVVTNDGELANKLTKAASGVEKTYLVKVAGQPTEAELDVLRGGVTIERGKPGSGQVKTSPARIRQVRQGDNPWYEVVLIEGRNRELRKMFEEVGHFVEKIRRVGYGPLVLDQEPGNLRELEPEELDLLRKAADGTLRTPKAKELRRRNAMDAQLPTLLPKPSRLRPSAPAGERRLHAAPGEFRPKKEFGGRTPERPPRPGGPGYRPTAGRTGAGPAKFGAPPKFGSAKFSAERPAWKKDDRAVRPPPARFGGGPAREGRAGTERSRSGPGGPRRAGGAFGSKPAWKKPDEGERPAFKRPGGAQRVKPFVPTDFEPPKPSRLQIEAIGPDRAGMDGPSSSRSSFSRPNSGRPPYRASGAGRPGGGDRPRQSNAGTDRSRFDRPKFGRPGGDRPSGGPGRTGAAAFGRGRPARSEGGPARPFTTSSGKPRAGGARPSSKPSGGRSYGAGSGSRSAAGGAGKAGWKPKPSFGGEGKASSSGRSKPAFGSKPGGAAKSGSGYKGKPGGAGGKRSGPRPGGPRPGGKHASGPARGKKRG
jgi:23S rRNA pseudouridine2605 synthase